MSDELLSAAPWDCPNDLLPGAPRRPSPLKRWTHTLRIGLPCQDMVVEWPAATMVARSADELPDDGRYAYEPKADGWRVLAHRNERPRLQSRHGRSLTSLFPEVVEHLGTLPPETVIDGELVAIVNGRIDFTGLHRPSSTKRLMVFDLLAVRGRDVRREPYEARRERLSALIAGGPLVLMPSSDDPAVASLWMTEHGDAGIEGVVAKRRDHAYRPGKRWWTKVKARSSAEAVVGGVVGPLEQPTALILGRPDDTGRLRIVGRTLPLQRQASLELGRQLIEPRRVHPWPTVIPGGRLGLPGHDGVVHTPVEPDVVVELSVDNAFEAGRWRHGARFIRVRPDLHPGDVG